MSENDNKPKIIRTSAGKTRLTASQSSKSGQQPAKAPETKAETPRVAGSKGAPTTPPPTSSSSSSSAGTSSGSSPKSGGAEKGSDSKVRSTSKGVRLGGNKSDAGKTQAVPASGASRGESPTVVSSGGAGAKSSSPAGSQSGQSGQSGSQSGSDNAPSSQVGSGPRATQSAPTQTDKTQVSGAGSGIGSAPTQVGSPAGGAAATVGSGPSHTESATTSGSKRSKEGVRATSAGVKMKGSKKSGPRSVNLTVASVDLWSVSKMALLLSVALGIATIVAFVVLWLVMQATGTLESIRGTLGEIAGPESAEKMLSLLGFGPVVSFAVILAVVNVVLMTALATLFGFLYNLGAAMVGGFRLTLVDD